MSTLLSLALALTLGFGNFGRVEAALPAIEIKGNKFFYSNNGSQFYVKGVAYQADVANSTDASTFIDPLADAAGCKRDIPYLKQLNTNVIRVYAINTTEDHTECMNALQDAGIYVISDLSEPSLSVNRDNPQWDVALYARYTSVIDALANYTNVLGFFAGNEVTNNSTNTDASPFVKAAVRDMKAYIKAKNYRSIPVGYSTNDDADTRLELADYFACGSSDEKVDFYGINMYEWCGDSTFQSSGFADRTKEFSNISIPLFFSEYGCNAVQPRKFQEVSALFSNNMTDVWSGGIVYMYFQETNNYGLVTVGSDSSVTPLSDFSYLSSEMAIITPTSTNSDSYSPSSAATIDCPASTLQYWKAATALPPTPDDNVCSCIDNSVACRIGTSVQAKDFSDLFSYICGSGVSCDAVQVNGSSGVYGDVSFCNPDTQLNYLLNQYYSSNGQSSSACDFSGSATLISSRRSSTASLCLSSYSSGAIATASISNTGTTGAGTRATSATGTGSSSTSTSTSSSKNKSAANTFENPFSATVLGYLFSAMFVVVPLGFFL